MPPTPDLLAIELQNRIASFHRLAEAWDQDPSQGNLQALESCMTGLEEFLDNNKKALFQAAAAHGWTANGPAGSNFSAFYSGALNGIRAFFERPNGASLTLVSEQTVQMHWLLTHFWNKP